MQEGRIMKKAIITAIAIFGMSVIASAQSRITDQAIVHDGKDAIVTFSIGTDDNSIPSNRKEIIMPYIYNGKDTVWLETVEVYGKNRYKREKQENHLDGNKDWDLEEGQIHQGDSYSYRDTAPLKRWMAPVNLGIRREIVGCACEEELADEKNLASATLFEEPPVEPRRIPKDFAVADATKEWDFGQDELEIIFKVSKIEIDSTVFNNEVTFGKILAAVDKIYSNPKFRVDKIEIAGYASPEGRQSFNKWLGENRAKALIDYIIESRPQYNLTQNHFRLRNGEENWAGLRRHLLASSIEEKAQVVEIMDMDLPDEEKKLKIKAIDKGKVWKKMLKEVYPHLRCARYLAVYYESAQDDAVDVINQANQMIREGKYAEAYELALPYGDDFRAYNTVGVALMMQGEFEKALPWLEKALKEDSKEAQGNIDAINAELKYEEMKRMEREAYLKKFE